MLFVVHKSSINMKKKEYIDVFFFTPTFLSECPSTREPIVYAVLNVKYSISKQECFYSNSAGKQVSVNNMGNIYDLIFCFFFY